MPDGAEGVIDPEELAGLVRVPVGHQLAAVRALTVRQPQLSAAASASITR